ncbi:hypothetical protein E1B28_007212 [Marasmius oreades]|uniref:Uncharacterized protein n=1 Tax=Marasmius oreades TaxID=181124 RepID=A0A9P7UUP4_9AGAR|nr:uncharacterized protein E1B28_007212 [Marasmius oreades]KAG7093541.1 hypothetical protein E1B28_007212 [Marasmius oreades]
MIFYLSILAFVSLILILLHRFYKPILPFPALASRLPRLRMPHGHRPHAGYTPLNTFADQAAAGLSSSNFDIESANILGGDSRVGLDEQDVREVEGIMKETRVGFDQARLIRHNRILAANGIDPSGMPLDSKAVTRL